MDSENCSCPLSQKPVQKRFLPQKGASLSVEGVFAKKFLRCGSEIAPDPRRGNPVSPLPRVRRTINYWIGGLLGLLVLSGCKSDRLSERGQPFSAASINSMLHGLRSQFSHRRLDDRDLVPVRFLARTLSSGGLVSEIAPWCWGRSCLARVWALVADKAPSPFRAAIHSGKVPPRWGTMLAS